MYYVVSVLIIIVCVLLVLVVLVQNSKGGGLSASFGGAGQTMGVRRTADFLEKATWTLAIILLVLSLGGTMLIPEKHKEQMKSRLEGQVQDVRNPVNTQVPPEAPIRQENQGETE